MTKNKKTGLKILYIILSILVSIKMLFVGFGMDEEYQVVMAYRNATGDKLFFDMWEPHQSSAFLCTLLMKPYLALFGTTGIVLYLKFCGTLFHLGITLYLYHVLKNMIGRDYAWILGIIYFNTIPKQIILPEFGIMQVWFYTLLSLFLIQYYRSGGKIRYLVLASLSLALTVLSYPSCLILYPFVLLWLFRLSGKNKWRDMGIITLVCGLCGAGYLGMLLSYASPSKLFSTISNILNGDITHSLTLGNKLRSLLADSSYLAALWGGCFLVSFIIGKLKKLEWQKILFLTAMSACVVEVYYWSVLHSGYETMQIHLIAIALLGCLSCTRNTFVSKTDAVTDNLTLCTRLLKYSMLGAVLCLAAVVYLTDLSLIPSVPHAVPAAFYGMALLILSLKDESKKHLSRWVYATLFVWCLTAIIGKGYTLRGNAQYNNIFQSRGIMRNGPAAGTISNYMGAYIYNCDYENWQTYLQDGDSVLIVVDQLINLGTIQYLFKDVEVAHFSIINPTAYDERLLEYWEMYPYKMPNVIIVDCWYGALKENPNSWIMQYIEEDFGYTQVDDGDYIRIYRRE